mmetsp:Transcript_18058/g.27065  ORF Transcript_18058/g.27065 Transcript_18058/m.27065 type:complete len:124 (+) Transcript_18058:58-429(+)
MVKMIAQYKPRVVKCSRKLKKSKGPTKIQSSKGLHKKIANKMKSRDKRIIEDAGHYCSIENLPSNTTIGGSLSLKALVLEATNSPSGDNEDDTLNDASAKYSDFDFKSDDEDDEGYSLESFEA